MKEQNIQRQIIEYLTLEGFFVIKNNTVGVYVKKRDTYIPNPAKGLADITAIRNGKVIMIEVKNERGVQTPNQIDFQNKWEQAGGTYILVRSLDDLILGLRFIL